MISIIQANRSGLVQGRTSLQTNGHIGPIVPWSVHVRLVGKACDSAELRSEVVAVSESVGVALQDHCVDCTQHCEGG